ncbi:hypothetical protein CR513_57168, partial [Mucuna pruriens]
MRLLAMLRLFNLKEKMGELIKLLKTCFVKGIYYQIVPMRQRRYSIQWCGESRYKNKDGVCSSDVSIRGPLAKVLWYLLINLRFKTLFANSNDANLRWHVDERKFDGQLQYTANSMQWKKIDKFPNFGNELRN